MARTTAASDRRTLWLIAAACLLPLAAAYAVYLVRPPAQHMNHGQLLPTQPLPGAMLHEPDGGRYGIEALRGSWLLVTIQPPGCDDACQRKLFVMRQARAAQGQHMARVRRLWLLRGEGIPDQGLISQHPGLTVARPVDSSWLAAFPATGDIGRHIYLIDPLGNLVLRYDESLDPRGLIKDLARLLRVSHIG